MFQLGSDQLAVPRVSRRSILHVEVESLPHIKVGFVSSAPLLLQSGVVFKDTSGRPQPCGKLRAIVVERFTSMTVRIAILTSSTKTCWLFRWSGDLATTHGKLKAAVVGDYPPATIRSLFSDPWLETKWSLRNNQQLFCSRLAVKSNIFETCWLFRRSDDLIMWQPKWW